MDTRAAARTRAAGRLALTLLAAGGLALVLLLLLPAGAGSQARGNYGGTLVVGIAGGDPDSLDPTVSRGTGIAIYPAMCLRIYQYVRNHGRIEMAPLLAASLPTLSKDKLRYTVRLRKGVLFNDGTSFDAQAVVATVRRFMTYPGSSRATDYAAVARVTAPGPYTVVYHLKAPDSAFVGNPYVLSPTAVEKAGATFGANPVCVAPFMFDHRVAGDSVTVIKSPYYFDRKNVYLDKIVYKPMANAAAAAAALRAGDIQALDQVSATELEAIREDSRLRVLSSPQLGWRGLAINVGNANGAGRPPYRNVGTPLASSPLLRQAFEEAIDRATVNRIVFGGLFEPTCTPIPPANTTWYPAVKVRCTPYDPGHARMLVARSGLSNPTVRLLTSTQTDSVRLSQVIQAQAAAVGINVVIDVTDTATLTARLTSGDFEIGITGLLPGSVEPAGLIHQFFETSGVRNYSGYSSPRMDYVLRNALRATKLEARATNYRVVHQILRDDRPVIFLYNATTLAGISRSLHGATLASNGQLLVDRAWFD